MLYNVTYLEAAANSDRGGPIGAPPQVYDEMGRYYIEDLPDNISFLAMKNNGYSMVSAGIEHGDILLFTKSPIRDLDLVVILTKDYGWLVKRYQSFKNDDEELECV